MLKKLFLVLLIFPTLFISSCHKSLSSQKSGKGTMNLLDAQYQNSWRGYNGKTLPPGWIIKDGVLYFDLQLKSNQAYSGGKDVIFGGREFEYFDLTVDWKIPAGGNSGIYYHMKEGYKSPTEMAPEYQLIDDENYAKMHDLEKYNKQFGAKNPKELQDWQMTGADYAMHVANDKVKVLNPAGEWNTTRIVVSKKGTEHWLNGVKLLSFKPFTPEWYEKKDSGKWKNMPDYGKFTTGYIGFQDHGSQLSFKNIKVKSL